MSRKLLFCSCLVAVCSMFVAVGSAAANPLGTVTNYKTAVFLLHFNDEPAPSYSAQSARNDVFDGPDSANALFLEASWGRVGLTGVNSPDGDVFGYLTIPRAKPANDCEATNGNVTDGIDAIAAQQGIPVDQYDRIIYAIPSCIGQAFGGGGRAWLLGTTIDRPLYVVHEFSHSFPTPLEEFGFEHAGSWQCAEGPLGSIPATISTTCQNRDYADPWDFMGSWSERGPSIRNKIAMGLLPASMSSDVSAEGVYDIYPTSEEPQAGRTYNLRIPLANEPDSVYASSPTTPTNLPKELVHMNLEYRRPSGHFNADLGVPESRVGAQIRVARGMDGLYTNQSNGTMILDADPHTRPQLWWSRLYQPQTIFNDYIYLPGDEPERYDALNEDTGLYDPQNDVLLSVVGRDATKLQVRYSKGLLASEKTTVGVVGGVLQITARPGYANDLYIREVNGVITVRDGNAPVLPGAGCTQNAKHIAHCVRTGINSVAISTGDRRDYVDMKLTPIPSSVDTGDGDDVVSVAPSWSMDTLDCGAGSDIAFADDDNTLTSCEDPTVLSTQITSGPTWKSSDTTPTFAFESAENGVTFECSNDLLGQDYDWSPCSGSAEFGPLADGHYAFYVRATNSRGWTDTTPDMRTYYVDTTAPAVTISSPADGSTTTSTTPALAFTATDLISHNETCSIDGGTFGLCPSQLPTLSPGAHSVAVNSIDELGQATTVVSNFTVAVPAALSISGPSTISSPVNLTTGGSLDWVHWGRSSATTVDRKSSTNLISNASLLPAGGTRTRVTSGIPTYTWSNGISPVSASTASAIYVGGAINRGFSLTAPATNSATRTLKLYVGALSTTGKLTVTLSDGSAPSVVNTSVSTSSTTTAQHRVLTVTYRSASPTATLDVDWRQNTSSSRGRVYLHSATLATN